jgi:hypothetical protein
VYYANAHVNIKQQEIIKSWNDSILGTWALAAVLPGFKAISTITGCVNLDNLVKLHCVVGFSHQHLPCEL